MKYLVFALSFLLVLGGMAQAALPYDFQLLFNDSGNPGMDTGGNGNDGVLNGSATWVPNGISGGAIELAGSDGYIEVEMDVAETNFTMMLWIKTDVPDVGVYSVLDGAAGAGGHDRHFYLTEGNICFRVWQGAGWCTETPVADGEWHHIALVAEDGVGQIAYVDGVEIGTNEYDHSDFDWQKRVWIGFSNDAPQNYFVGMIDEAAYIAAPLSPDEVAGAIVAVEPVGKLAATWSGMKSSY